jgi:hypothetical protein
MENIFRREDMNRQRNPRSRTTPTRKRLLLDAGYVLFGLIGIIIFLYLMIGVLISRFLLGIHTWFDYAMGILCIYLIGLFFYGCKVLYETVARFWKTRE